MRFCLMSDTHNQHNKVAMPVSCDVLLHAGDFTSRGTFFEVKAFNDWLREQPHRFKVVVSGNHDWLFEKDPGLARSLITDATYLQDQGCEIEGLKIWGSPWQPWFHSWAFNAQRGEDIKRHWDRIPDDTDVLITHGPPYGILDKNLEGESVGCEELLKAVLRVRPKLHVFGHIHEGYGEHFFDGIRFVNASNCTRQYMPTNPPIVVDL